VCCVLCAACCRLRLRLHCSLPTPPQPPHYYKLQAPIHPLPAVFLGVAAALCPLSTTPQAAHPHLPVLPYLQFYSPTPCVYYLHYAAFGTTAPPIASRLLPRPSRSLPATVHRQPCPPPPVPLGAASGLFAPPLPSTTCSTARQCHSLGNGGRNRAIPWTLALLRPPISRE
jgi:hypothetical protein